MKYSGALPVVCLWVDGRRCQALVDTGCTDTVVHQVRCTHWDPQRTQLVTLGRNAISCSGRGYVKIQLNEGSQANVEVLTVKDAPLGFDVILGMNGICALGGVTIQSPSEVYFNSNNSSPPITCCAKTSNSAGYISSVHNDPEINETCETNAKTYSNSDILIDAPDFTVRYNAARKAWTVSWKWNGSEPQALSNTTPQY